MSASRMSPGNVRDALHALDGRRITLVRPDGCRYTGRASGTEILGDPATGVLVGPECAVLVDARGERWSVPIDDVVSISGGGDA
ncbi:MAG: hypothetical protein IPG50_09485 [Myxococcales bacterium]|nr:hypothetical protein [Myxococcales bacterium]